jgi:DsbC/DsbD-like thiol-disulfide interchange protein
MLLMMIMRRLGLIIGLMAIPFAQQTSAQLYEGRELVKATLVADTNAIVPGKSFTVGLLLRMAPAWHTYWKFAGDAGLPTELKWKSAPGWKVGALQWPIPLKTNDPGDIQTYGYENEVLLMQTITPPKDGFAGANNSSVKLTADANWLVCEKICIPGSASLQLDLPVSTTNEPKNSDLFAGYRRLLPQSWPDSKTASAKWNRVGSDLQLTITSTTLASHPAADFYPLPRQDVVVGHPKIESRNAKEIVFQIPIETPPKN